MDALTGAAIDTAAIRVDGVSCLADASGRFHVGDVKRGARVEVEADRYEPFMTAANDGELLRVAMQPTHLSGLVKNRRSGEPVAQATVAAGDVTGRTDALGRYELMRFEDGSTITVVADGFEKAVASYDGDSTLNIELRPNSLRGVVTDAGTGKPVVGARVIAGTAEAITDASGSFQLKNLPEKPIVVVKATGYEKATVEAGDEFEPQIRLKPLVVKAAYLTYYGVGDKGLRENVFHLLQTTELNAVVIDVKGDLGKIVYRSSVPLAQKIGAQDPVPPVSDIDALLSYCQAHDIYTIARIVVFKDDKLARNGPEVGLDVAAKDRRTGGPVIDREGLGWVDPFRKEVWDYNIAIAKEAALKGFDEIQFDYIRFPTDFRDGGSYRDVIYSQPNTSENRVKTIAGFLAAAQAALAPSGTFISADVFGYTAWQDDDENMPVGQNIEEIAKYVDFISPMVYPSTFSYGLPIAPGYAPAPQYPYEIVYYSVKRAVERLQDTRAKVRPWLQYFDDYPWASGKPYNATEVGAQKKANYDAGGLGFMLWDPTNTYTRGGMDPE